MLQSRAKKDMEEICSIDSIATSSFQTGLLFSEGPEGPEALASSLSSLSSLDPLRSAGQLLRAVAGGGRRPDALSVGLSLQSYKTNLAKFTGG
jgi:hypothetical protein